MEHRKAPRKTAGIWAVVSCPQFGLFRGEIDNLSSTGLYLRTENVRVCLNAPVTVTIQSDADDFRGCCNADGRVVRQDPDGIGIRLTALDSKSSAVFHKLLDRLPEQSAFNGSSERLAV